MADKKMHASMVSMKRPKDERESQMAEPAKEAYGYGLCLRLENFELDKLKLKLPQVGTEMHLMAKGKVTAVHESKSEGNKGDRGVSIQITDLAIGDME